MRVNAAVAFALLSISTGVLSVPSCDDDDLHDVKIRGNKEGQERVSSLWGASGDCRDRELQRKLIDSIPPATTDSKLACYRAGVIEGVEDFLNQLDMRCDPDPGCLSDGDAFGHYGAILFCYVDKPSDMTMGVGCKGVDRRACQTAFGNYAGQNCASKPALTDTQKHWCTSA